ncbi:hypothetical protein Bca101_095296 [Brassica carinata]
MEERRRRKAIFFPALTKITVALGPNGGSITDADYHHETLDNLQIVITPIGEMLLQQSKAVQKCPNQFLRKLINWSTRRNYKGS